MRSLVRLWLGIILAVGGVPLLAQTAASSPSVESPETWFAQILAAHAALGGNQCDPNDANTCAQQRCSPVILFTGVGLRTPRGEGLIRVGGLATVPADCPLITSVYYSYQISGAWDIISEGTDRMNGADPWILERTLRGPLDGVGIPAGAYEFVWYVRATTADGTQSEDSGGVAIDVP